MGFKCRVMQLQGELDDHQSAGWADSGAKEEIDQLRSENEALREDLKQVKKERDSARERQQATPLPASSRTERVSSNISRDLYISCVRVYVCV